jgi:hypothetical protein
MPPLVKGAVRSTGRFGSIAVEKKTFANSSDSL